MDAAGEIKIGTLKKRDRFAKKRELKHRNQSDLRIAHHLTSCRQTGRRSPTWSPG